MMDQEYNYTPLSEPFPITEQVWPEGTLPLVCTSTLAYNHEPYIRECLDGILMQKTTFPVQVLVHEDCSTDKTAEILKEYQSKYPNLIKVFYQPENVYSLKDPAEKRKRRAEYNSWKIGKYIALCEGDDYWIDPLKLQKQVDFLEANPEYGMCHTDFNLVKGLRRHNFKEQKDDIYFPSILIEGMKVGTLTVVFRKQLYDSLPKYFLEKKFKMGDLPLWIEFSKFSKIKYLSFVSANYRIGNDTASHSYDINKELAGMDSVREVINFYSNIYNIKIKHRKGYYSGLMTLAFKHRNKTLARKFLKQSVSENSLSILLLYYYGLTIFPFGHYIHNIIKEIKK